MYQTRILGVQITSVNWTWSVVLNIYLKKLKWLIINLFLFDDTDLLLFVLEFHVFFRTIVVLLFFLISFSIYFAFEFFFLAKMTKRYILQKKLTSNSQIYLPYLSSFLICASWFEAMKMKITDGRVQKSTLKFKLSWFVYYILYRIMNMNNIFTWKPQNLGCCIGENLLKHIWLQPGCCVSHLNTPLKQISFLRNRFSKKSENYFENPNTYLFVAINASAESADNEHSENEIDCPP